MEALEVGVCAGGVVGRVADRDDLGHLALDGDLDPLLERDVDLRAALAAAAQLDVGDVVLHLEQVDEAAVRGDAGVDGVWLTGYRGAGRTEHPREAGERVPDAVLAWCALS